MIYSFGKEFEIHFNRSFLDVNSKCKVDVQNSKFINNSNIIGGSVLNAVGDGSEVSFTDTSFMNNTSQSGGVFIIYLKAFIQWTRWNITNNFAVTGGVVSALEGGSFKFIDSDIYKNYAVASPISEISSSHEGSEINNWRISSNINLTPDYVLNKYLDQGILIFHKSIEYIEESFKTHLINNPALLEYQASEYSLGVTSGYLKISSGTIFTNQGSVLTSAYSTIFIDEAIVKDSTSSTNFFNFIESTFTIENLEIKNITTGNKVYFMNMLSCIMNINNITFKDSSTVFLRGLLSTITMTNIYSK